MEDFKEKVTAAGEEITESVKQGAANFIDDAATLKHSVDEVADDRQAQKAAKAAEKANKEAAKAKAAADKEAAKAKAAGVKVRFTKYNGMFHVFQISGTLMDESKLAWAEVKRFLNEIKY